MLIIGCDFHPGFQQVAIFDNLTGEIEGKRLQHRAEAEQFYRLLAGQEVLVGMEACGHYPWFERLLEELGMELWLGDAARVRAAEVRKQKTDRRVGEEARQRPEAVRLMTHPGVGSVTALAMVLTLGPAERFASAKQVGSYFGLIPREESSGGKQRLGRISKQGSSFLRFLLVEAGQTAARLDPQLKRFYPGWRRAKIAASPRWRG
jgi:transposase